MQHLSYLLLTIVAVLQAGCSQFWLANSSQNNVSSSLVDYLYPEGMKNPVVQTTPLLQLPLRVGIAFVPGPENRAATLDAATRQRLLGTVADHFKQREYISDIEVIPDAYLAGGKGFDTLERVAGLYGLDVIALVSYDQQSFTADTKASFWYWTIVGAYMVEGSKNDVSTFVDTAVFDIPTRSLLMRAPGTSQLSQKSTAVDVAESLADNRVQGFEQAMQNMTENLSVELDQLQARVEAGEAGEVQIAHRPGYSGGGGGSGDLFLLGGLLLAGLWRSRRQPQ